MAITPPMDGRASAVAMGDQAMATKIMTRGMTAIDGAVIASMMTGLTLALIQYAQILALPVHFV